MRFGQDYHLLVSQWELPAVDYPKLNEMLKSAVRKAALSGAEPDFTEFLVCLKEMHSTISVAHDSKYQQIDTKEQNIWRNLEQDEAPPVSQLVYADRHELNNLHTAFSELRGELQQIQWCEFINEEAISRLCQKLHRFHKIVDLHQSRALDWVSANAIRRLTYLGKIQDIISCIEQAITSQRTPSHGSLRIKTICDKEGLEYPGVIVNAARNDDADTMTNFLDQSLMRGRKLSSTLYRGLLLFSITCLSKECASVLVSKSTIFGVDTDSSCLAHLLITIGRCMNLNISRSLEFELCYQLIDHIGSARFGTCDALSRSPLHYAALYGLPEVCRELFDSPIDGELSKSDLIKEILLSDFQGFTPLHLAATHEQTGCVKIFLDIFRQATEVLDIKKFRRDLNQLLLIAIQLQFDEIVQLLLTQPIDIDFRSTRGETLLYIAARIGREDYVSSLLEHSRDTKANIELKEPVLGWTPLFIASVEGHIDVVNALLTAGADQSIVDKNGWTVKEHATFRGHLHIAEVFAQYDFNDFTTGPGSIVFPCNVDHNLPLQSGCSHVVVNLGGMHQELSPRAIDLDNLLLSTFDKFQRPSTIYSIEVCSNQKDGPVFLHSLPLLDDTTNLPMVFPVEDSSGKPQLTFKIYSATVEKGAKGVLVGTGVALLESQNHILGNNRENLVRDQTIPIIDNNTLQILGTVTFTFLIVRPFSGKFHPSGTQHLPRSHERTKVVGHRGLGENLPTRRYLQLGENTVESFLTAANHGAEYVEFDVQMTRDLVPVAFHDFSLSETGTDVPIHDLSVNQFFHANAIQKPLNKQLSVLQDSDNNTTNMKTRQYKIRSRSVTADEEDGVQGIQDRLKYTLDFMSKGYKSNTRGSFIQSSFATFKQMLLELPDSVGFDVEIKYPRAHEARNAGMAPVGIEINTVVDIILDAINQFGRGRKFVISSFTPEVCICLILKQKSYPVMFLTNAGKYPQVDRERRAASLRVAVKFAKRWNLAGVIPRSDIVIMCPRLVRYVHNHGLHCASYGPLNNTPEYAKIQSGAGLDMVICDRVKLIHNTLQGPKCCTTPH